MPLHFIIIPLIIMGIIALFGLKGLNAKRMRKMFVAGVFLSLGGCVGALGWLGAETSGHRNMFHGVHPLVWVVLFGLGVVVLVVASYMTLSLRAQDKKNPPL